MPKFKYPIGASKRRSLQVPEGELFGLRVYEVSYRHAQDGIDYKHEFDSDVLAIGLPDGSILLQSAKGKRLWEYFDV